MSATIEAADGQGDLSYAGRAGLADDVLTHRVLVGDRHFPAGQDQIRHAGFDRDGHLVLTVPYPDGGVRYELVRRILDT